MEITHEEVTNVTTIERAFRATVGIIVLSIICANAIASPLAVFGLSVISFYLIMTSIIGNDPVYNLLSWSTQRLSRTRYEAGQASA